MDLQIRVEELKKGYVLIDMSGDMDAYTSKEFKRIVENLVKRRRYKLIVDLEKVTCMDSIGAGMLLGGLKKVRERKGNIWLIYNKSKARKFLEITGLDESFSIFKTRPQAFKKLSIR